MIVAVGFDGTIVDHVFPAIGDPVEGAFKTLKRLKELGCTLILYTMRSDGQKHGDVLTQAVEFCRSRGIEFDHVNCNPAQAEWTSSPKVYAHFYIDDAVVGVPLLSNARPGGKPYVDWGVVGPLIIAMAQRFAQRPTKEKT